jgi:catechol 2,3-dioxygenase-like lactoylglutathione lyase family enzyme
MSVTFKSPIPILRIFSLEKAKEFYLDFLGFKIDWEHTFEENLPVYMQISRGDCVLHLSEHHGDSVPGVAVYIPMTDIEAFNQELLAKQYKYLRPGIIDQDWDMREMHVIDPFGNKLRFAERITS